MHSMLAVTPEGLSLGVLGMKTWTCAPDEFGKGKLRKQHTIRDKESVKWLEGLEHLSALKARCPDTHIVGVCDREGDLYDVFVTERPAGVDWLVCAGWNRSVAHPEKYLWEAIAATPELGQTELQIPGSGNTIARTARLTLRCAPVRLRPPRYRRRKGLPYIEVFVIHALEAEVPEGLEPLEWMLLTSVPTSTREQALERLAESEDTLPRPIVLNLQDQPRRINAFEDDISQLEKRIGAFASALTTASICFRMRTLMSALSVAASITKSTATSR